MKNAKQVRQGDVLLTATTPDESVVPVVPESGLAVLARGEATGHHHSVSAAHAAIVAKGAERFLKVHRKVELRHQEHRPIQIARGNYEITIQVEFDPTTMARPVVD